MGAGRTSDSERLAEPPRPQKGFVEQIFTIGRAHEQKAVGSNCVDFVQEAWQQPGIHFPGNAVIPGPQVIHVIEKQQHVSVGDPRRLERFAEQLVHALL
jgi:hypothetical protein